MAVIRADFEEDYGLPPNFDTITPAHSRADEILAELREHHAKQARAAKSAATKPMESHEQTALLGTEAKPKRGKAYAFSWTKPWLLDDGRVYVKHGGQWWITSRTCPKATAYFAELNSDVDVRNWHEEQLRRMLRKESA